MPSAATQSVAKKSKYTPASRGVAAEKVRTVRATQKPTTSKALAALTDPDKPLTDMQKLFVKAWASGESITSASFRAGYVDGGSYGYRMAAMPAIIKLYNAEKLAYEAAAQMSRKKVMDMLLEAYDAAKYTEEPSSMVAAAREIGKLCGYYEPVKHKIDINVSGSIVHKRMSSMSDAELLDLIVGGKALEAIEDESEGPDA